jgi:lipoprotein-anchoring transpeptidase ErfK/SrfK
MKQIRVAGKLLSLSLALLASGVLPASQQTAQAAEPWAVQHPGVPDPSKQPGGKPQTNAVAPVTPAESGPPAAAPAEGASAPTKTPNLTGDGVVTLGTAIGKNGFHKGAPTLVLVDMGSHRTYVLQKQGGGKIVDVYSAADSVGSDKTPTPPGPYWIVVKKKFPEWLPPKDIDPKQKVVKPYNVDKKNPLGVARLGLNKWGINLHGTNQPGSISKSVSHGCIRHSNSDITKIFDMVEINTPVIIANQFAGTELSNKSFEKHGSSAGHKKSRHR